MQELTLLSLDYTWLVGYGKGDFLFEPVILDVCALVCLTSVTAKYSSLGAHSDFWRLKG